MCVYIYQVGCEVKHDFRESLKINTLVVISMCNVFLYLRDCRFLQMQFSPATLDRV